MHTVLTWTNRRPGKTAPRLVQDIYEYDPAHPPATGRSLLADVPPVFPEYYNGPLEHISSAACRHNFVSKPAQSYVPQSEQGNPGAPTKVSAVCLRCRYHLQVDVSSTPGIGQSSARFSDHVHHLVYKSGKYRGGAVPEEVSPKGQLLETFHYECSYLSCSVAVSVRFASPVLNDDRVRLLVDPEVLRERANEAFAAHPDRLEGVAPPAPINVLLNLRTYISNALLDSQQSKSISAVNKRFMTCFGVEGKPCKDLLEFLGFSSKNEGFWEPPRPNPWAEFPYRDQLKIFLDDVIHELTALIEQRPVVERKGHQLEFNRQPVFNDLLYSLESLDYPRPHDQVNFRWLLNRVSQLYYEDLGVVEDMAASLIIEAFNRQVSVDPSRTPVYLKCLKSIGILRGGEDGSLIDQAVQVAYSEGKYTEEDVVDAYKYFGLSHDDQRLTEESIIGKFYAYLGATTAVQETETRRQLWRIGDSRRSERIKAAAEERVSTAEQAQVFLGVSADTSDDFVMAVYTAKVNDNPSSRDLARRAVQLLAEERKSEALKHFLKTGEMTAGEMGVADAYRLLQIPDRTVDEGAIMAAYTICVDEAPGQAENYNQALRIIAKDKNSPLLSNMISGSATKPDRNLAEWPVGLQNIGNTCYLNSLLQFYFSIRPYRDMVLDFENFKMDIHEDMLSQKQVGSRKVSQKEVERSQRFLRELRTLFNDMITAQSTYVVPTQELARLTLISPSNEAAIRRRSTISGIRPSALGEINGVPVMGPLGPPQPTIESEANELIAPEPEKPQRSTTSDVDSETTLVSDGTRIDATVPLPNDKEPEPLRADSTKMVAQGESTPEAVEYQPSDRPASAEQNEQNVPSSQPPPVPPRPGPQPDPQRQLIEEVEIGAQQDVTEVINNVLFQSQCAIKPISLAPDGEQLDQVKDLFYGKAKSYIQTPEGVRSKEEWWCDIKIDVATGSRDIYAAIDGAFDVQKVSVDNSVAEQFSAISKLPPVLQVQVQRVQFDPVKKRSFKSTHHLELKETIYLDRYMDTQQPEILNRRRQCWEWKNALRTLEARRAELQRQSEADGLDIPSLFDNAKDVLEELNSMKEDPETAADAVPINPELIPELNQLSQIARAELNYIEQEIKDLQTMISSQFADYKHLAYRLYAVFVHHGSVEFGHYYIYICDFERNVWRKYNDNYVTEVHDLDEIFTSQDRQNPPTPYFLVYVNATMKDRLVSPLCREILESPPDDQPSVDMANDTKAVTAPTAAEDVDMNPPAYDEIWTDKGTSGTEDNHHIEDKTGPTGVGGNGVTGRGPSNKDTDFHDVQW
ncbi:putative ubiquitin C-terminal hydrolase [Aspergillus bombycis]|uniref:ubiquitinyl hydrolase 1 n=1 Tax=Aspergillus bombycis TaxID=109264 RepID=A0A1F7ZKV5_9EURO|nr:putative ubiquitin C-terminal hydrolase [Aspergillus bombycis]OGM39949.1 putative ubiquitin C-terminal hydrolase [Aspergillus bombycis]